MTTVLELGHIVIVVGSGIALGFGYFKRRNPGFLVLLVPLPLWVLVERASRSYISSQINSIEQGGRPAFPLIFGGDNLGEMVVRYFYATEIIQWMLVVVGVLLLALWQRPVRAAEVEAELLESDLHVPA